MKVSHRQLLGLALTCVIALHHCSLVAAAVQPLPQQDGYEPINKLPATSSRKLAQGWEIALGIIGVVIGGTAYATSISCSIFSTANKNYCPNKCTEFNAKYLPYLPKGPNVGGKCVGGKCECTIFGTELPKCTVQKWGSNGNRVQWLTYPGRCARYSFQCPSNSRIASMGTTGVSGCPKGQVCCH